MAHEGNHICLHRFSFHKPIKSRLARGHLYLPNLRYGTHGYGMDTYEGIAKINLHSQSKLIITSVNKF